MDVAAEMALDGDASPDVLLTARVRLTKCRMREALFALEEAGIHGASAQEVAQLEQDYARELAAYTTVMHTGDEARSDG